MPPGRNPTELVRFEVSTPHSRISWEPQHLGMGTARTQELIDNRCIEHRAAESARSWNGHIVRRCVPPAFDQSVSWYSAGT